MSMFSLIRRGRQAAKEQRAKQAEQQKKEEHKAPYKHIPKHAAIDAASSGPAGWRDEDRTRILEQNRRRSAMTASGIGMGGMTTPIHMGMPRVHSALSHVSYPAAYASPVVQVPRTYSYSSMPPGWNQHVSDFNYSPVDQSTSKGKGVERVMVDSGRASRASSKASAGRAPFEGFVLAKDPAHSPVDSSSNSTSSQDDLEMKPVRHAARSSPPGAYVTPALMTPAGRPLGEAEPSHRLHPSQSRRISDPGQTVGSPRSSFVTPQTRPGRGASNASLAAAGIPPVPALPPMQFGTALTSSVAASSTTSVASSTTMAPVASSTSIVAKFPTHVSVKEVDEIEVPTKPTEIEPISVATMAPVQTAPLPKSGRRVSKVTRFTELETIHSSISASVETPGLPPKGAREKPRANIEVSALPINFDESALPSPQELVLPSQVLPVQKSGKLSKTQAPKPVKKNRWSLMRSNKTEVSAA